jgi:hypothetical protein
MLDASERRVRALEKRLAELEQTPQRPNHTASSSSATRALPQMVGHGQNVTPVSVGSLPPVCEDPYVTDENGVRRLRADCMDQATPGQLRADDECRRPFQVGTDGVKRFKRQCL